jgi:hypothetical protein
VLSTLGSRSDHDCDAVTMGGERACCMPCLMRRWLVALWDGGGAELYIYTYRWALLYSAVDFSLTESKLEDEH